MRPKICLVDDNIDLVTAYAEALRDDFEVMTFQSADEALSAIEKRKPDVVVADIKMPRMDGLEFIRRLRSSGFANPIVLMSGTCDPLVEMRAVENQVFAFLEKPCQLAQLRQLITRAVVCSSASRLGRSLVQQYEQIRESLESLVDTEKHLVNLCGQIDGRTDAQLMTLSESCHEALLRQQLLDNRDELGKLLERHFRKTG